MRDHKITAAIFFGGLLLKASEHLVLTDRTFKVIG